MNETSNESDKLIYEVGYHLLPTVEEEHVPAEAEKVRSAIEAQGGAVISEEMPKIMSLSYEIWKSINAKRQAFNRAYFGWIKFEAEPSVIAGLKNKIDNLPDILRFIIVKTVREETLRAHKIPVFKKEHVKEGSEEGSEKKPEASEEEIDKSIDELLAPEKVEN